MAKRPKSNSVNPCETRESLIRFAARTFGTQGYSATTMRNIADQAGIEAASIYYHFPSKEELVEAVMEQGAAHIVHHLNEHLDALSPDATAEQRFRAAVLGQMRGLVIHGDFAVAHGRLLGQLPDAIRERQVARREHHQTLWNGLLEDLRAEGSLREDVDIPLARIHILGSINSIQSWFNPQKGSLERIADQLCTMFLCGVGPSSRP
ncbi:TetR/AcrR family transcriptional regulator [Burkholderia sp. LA-2-3-30-S1-D2]|uniref:TetR/AcrR family transcriptional regulator n=1 Tax=Burkholderia sp. LA-2-3-30-S1-D2 TaxID=1637862 RepID=UPI00075D17F3|nr:TetR/AcrR family transcriptional regulator [Burkholderia sp. LA-2-3-30-S1-D2]AOI99908.1 TetR family transcriptional regulator [Burkholderia sp. LA-2-3-30-S1-D2]KVE16727.1 TetR family transcriptional regulator [Burkholderia sp. LA-2-3-30-S1-D2]